MMIEIPSPAEIIRRRHTLAIVIRCFATLLAITGMYSFGTWALGGYLDDDFWQMEYYAGQATWTLVSAIVSIGLFVLAPLFARFLMPRSLRGCPGCGYDAQADRTYPECGRDLDPRALFLVGERRSGLRERRVHLVSTWLRVFVAFLAGLILIRVGGTYANWQIWGSGGMFDPAYQEWYLTQNAAYLLLCLSGFLLSTSIARVMVPGLPDTLADTQQQGGSSDLKSEPTDPQ